MGTNIKRCKTLILKTLPGLLLILFAFFLFLYYPKNLSSKSATKTTTFKVTAPQPTTKTLYQVFDEVKKDSNASVATKIKEYEKEARKRINYKSSVPYKVKINRAENFVMIYGNDITGKYTIPYKCFICSTAKNIKNTLLGKYRLNDRYRWHTMVDGSYAQYAIRFYDKLMLHSVPYYEKSPDSLEINEYNKLGHSASLGCIRMRVSDIKWIYDKCKSGTEITIYDKGGEKPPILYDKPKKLDKKETKASWDPTDPNKKNPWNK